MKINYILLCLFSVFSINNSYGMNEINPWLENSNQEVTLLETPDTTIFDDTEMNTVDYSIDTIHYSTSCTNSHNPSTPESPNNINLNMPQQVVNITYDTVASNCAFTKRRKKCDSDYQFTCTKCPNPKTFSTITTLRRHIAATHNQTGPTCSICSKVFCKVNNLTTHMNSVHSEPKHKCHYPECTNVYRYNKDLKNHILQHEGQIFNCSICTFSAKNKRSLANHMKVGHNK